MHLQYACGIWTAVPHIHLLRNISFWSQSLAAVNRFISEGTYKNMTGNLNATLGYSVYHMPHLHWATIILVLIGLASIACGEIKSCLSDDSLPTSHPYITHVAYLGSVSWDFPSQKDTNHTCSLVQPLFKIDQLSFWWICNVFYLASQTISLNQMKHQSCTSPLLHCKCFLLSQFVNNSWAEAAADMSRLLQQRHDGADEVMECRP